MNALQRQDRLVTRHYGGIARAIQQAVRSLKPDEMALRQALSRRQTEKALDTFPWPRFRDALYQAAWDAIHAAAKGAGRAELHKDITGSFDVVNPRAVIAAATQAADLVTSIDAETRQAIREIIRRGQLGQLDIDAQVKLLRQVVGLNTPQANAAMNYYLARQIDNPDLADELTAKYVDRALGQRAEMIARTETIRAANVGQQEAWQQALEQGLIDRSALQVWVASDDACPECEALDGEAVPLGESFSSGDDGPPAHPNCRCALSLDTSADLAEV